ncbi:MAG: RnfABCDGE type electron transport complex subunit B [Clostridiales bacterium]|nr:RnfABCDGE type electron transport complex subunit B [Candidatus Crickella caballi]
MGSVMTPVLVVAVIGMLCAGLLVVASKVFFVEVDERITQVRECLPGANCGGCGFAGCDDYAANLVEDETMPCTKCAPGGAAAAEAIAKVLGRDAGSAEPQVAQVLCNGTCGASKKVLEWQGLQSCKGAKGWFSTPNACMFGCIGLGDCVNVCEFQGIGIVDGVARVNRNNCVACGMCANVCPQQIIKLVPQKSMVHVVCSSTDKGAVARKNCDNACIGCMKCTKACNFDAITVEDNLARIDYSKCKSCGMCVTQCPTGALNTLKPMTKEAFDKLKENTDKAIAKKAEKAKAAAAAAKAE